MIAVNESAEAQRVLSSSRRLPDREAVRGVLRDLQRLRSERARVMRELT
jgi:hypothetical protein